MTPLDIVVAGAHEMARAGHNGVAIAGDYGTAIAGNRSTAIAGYRGTAIAGDYGAVAIAGAGGAAAVGDHGIASVSYGGTASAGAGGVLVFRLLAEVDIIVTGHVGTGRIRPRTAYRLDDGGEIVRAPGAAEAIIAATMSIDTGPDSPS